MVFLRALLIHPTLITGPIRCLLGCWLMRVPIKLSGLAGLLGGSLAGLLGSLIRCSISGFLGRLPGGRLASRLIRASSRLIIGKLIGLICRLIRRPVRTLFRSRVLCLLIWPPVPWKSEERETWVFPEIVAKGFSAEVSSNRMVE